MQKESTTESQNKSILDHLRSGKTITQIEAYKSFGCTRLSARIYDLRQAMEDAGNAESISSVSVSFTAPSGKKGRYCRYYIKNLPAVTSTK